MLIIPAVDIKDGRVVRLYQGRKDKESVYSDRPVDVALNWAKSGAKMIHFVDLDGAFCGTPKNMGLLKGMLEKFKEEGLTDVAFEFGGGVRTKEDIEELLDIGASRVILGTVAFEDREFLEKAVARFKDKIIVSIDVKGKGLVALKGWVEDSDKDNSFASFVKYLNDIGMKKIIYTDIVKDGTLSGPNIVSLSEVFAMLYGYGIKMVLAGGISSLDDLNALKQFELQGLEGVIVGKALYEGRFTLVEALKIGGKHV